MQKNECRTDGLKEDSAEQSAHNCSGTTEDAYAADNR